MFEFLNDLGRSNSSKMKGRFLKTGNAVLLIGLSCIMDGQSMERRFIERDDRRSPLQEIQNFSPIIYQRKKKDIQEERQNALNIIRGVVSMYGEDVQFNNMEPIKINVEEVVLRLNASYTHATKTFNFPHVSRSSWSIIRTAMDQGIVSHEAGHMVLHYLCEFRYTAHTGAFHEAFGDLTSHFYSFYNPETRQKFLRRLQRGQGCVGDTDFTCTRDSSQALTLSHVESNQTLCEVHELSRAFSSAVYQSMRDAFGKREANLADEYIAGEIVGWHKRTLVDSVLSLQIPNPTLMSMAWLMLDVCTPTYRNDLGNNFIRNGLIVLMPRYLLDRNGVLYQSTDYYYYQPNKEFSTLCLTQNGHKKAGNTFGINRLPNQACCSPRSRTLSSDF